MSSMDITVVIASNREDSFNRWMEAWAGDLGNARVILVEDNRRKTFKYNRSAYKYFDHYAWDDIERNLEDSAWIIPRRTSAVKSYGFWEAKGAEAVWTLDDDCFPDDAFKGRYLKIIGERLSNSPPNSSPWYNTIGHTELYPRGYPYGIRHESEGLTMINHGLWSGVPDLDGITALEHPNRRLGTCLFNAAIPRGKAFPMCGMNLAFRSEMLPAMYFMLQGSVIRSPGCAEESLPFDRFDDIWAGLFAKKVCDHFGWTVMTGSPSIRHTKESDPSMRVLKEAPGIVANEELWKLVDGTPLAGCDTVQAAYKKLAGALTSTRDHPVLKRWTPYWNQLSRAMSTWAELF